MNIFALIIFALWAIFLRNLPKILEFLKVYQFSKTVPGPTLREFLQNVEKGQILSWFKDLRKKYGSTFAIWFGKDLMVFFTEPEDTKQILSNNTLLYKSSSYELLSPWLGKGLLTNGGAAWHRRRKLLTPAFHFKILSEFKEPMEENCKILISLLKEKANGKPFDIYPYITLFALDTICETAMGIKKNAQLERDCDYVKAVQEICHIIHKQSFSFWKRFEFIFRFTDHGKRRKAALETLHGETIRVIELRRAMLKKSQINKMADVDNCESVLGVKRRFAFLDILLISQMEDKDLTDLEIREEVDTFMFEGHDTTSSALGFALYLLSQDLNVQKKAYEEIVDFEGREKESMPYLEAVIKETLRLYPPVPFFSRQLHEECQIGKYNLPKGTLISTLAFMIHRDEKNFPNPEKFDPERFLYKEKELHPYSFVAFSAGPRNCIGQKFAMLELKCTLSNLLRNFEVLPAEGFQPNPLAELVTKSGNGIQVCLKPRST